MRLALLKEAPRPEEGMITRSPHLHVYGKTNDRRVKVVFSPDIGGYATTYSAAVYFLDKPGVWNAEAAYKTCAPYSLISSFLRHLDKVDGLEVSRNVLGDEKSVIYLAGLDVSDMNEAERTAAARSRETGLTSACLCLAHQAAELVFPPPSSPPSLLPAEVV